MVEGLGPGRFGPVYRGQDEAGLFVSIKVFDQGLTQDQAAALAAMLDKLRDAPLNHPGIVPVIAAAAVEERVWLAEPWFDAEPLDAVMLRDAGLPVADTLIAITQVAGALDFAAAVEIFHGALHPRDILVTPAQTVLSGIGLIQALSDAGLAVPMEGAYVSPQRAQGIAVSSADDIFALAAISYELVFGVPVPSPSELRKVTTQPRGIQANRFLDVVEKAMSPDPGDRPLTALRLAAAIQETVAISAPVPDPHSATAASPLAFDSEVQIHRPEPPSPTTGDLPLRAAEPEPAFRHEPVPRPEPPVRNEPVVRHEPVVRPEPVMRHEPVVRHEPTVRHEVAPRHEPAPRHEDRKRNQESESEHESGIWFPLSATLAIGLLMGFAGGYVAGQRDATPTPHAAERPVARNGATPEPRRGEETPAPTAGRDFSESVVPAPSGSNRAAQPSREAEAPAQQNAVAPTQPGVLQVDSRPRGAQVFVDGRLVGRTPVVVPEVRPGPHAVRIDLRGHRRWVTSVDVAPGERHRVAASLER